MRAKRKGKKRRRRKRRRRRIRRRGRKDPLFRPFDRGRQRQKAPCVLLDALSFTLLSLSFTFLSVSPHLGRGPSTVCDPRPTFSSSIQNHYTTIGTSIELAATFFRPRGATFYFFFFVFFFFFFFFFVVFDLVLGSSSTTILLPSLSTTVSFSHSSSFSPFFLSFSHSLPAVLQLHASTSFIGVHVPIHLPSPSYLANGTAQASP